MANKAKGPDPYEGWRGEGGRILEGAPGGYHAPGEVGRGGRPRKMDERWVDVIKEEVGIEEVRAIVAKAVEQAKRGNRFARDFLWDRAVGKPRQIMETPGGDSPLLALFTLWMGHPEAQAGPETEPLPAGVTKVLEAGADTIVQECSSDAGFWNEVLEKDGDEGRR